MITQCAWCGHVMGQSGPTEDKRITHTICSPCFESTCGCGAGSEETPATTERRSIAQSRKVA